LALFTLIAVEVWIVWNFFKNPRWRTATIFKIEKLPYLNNSLADWDEIRQDEANWAS